MLNTRRLGLWRFRRRTRHAEDWHNLSRLCGFAAVWANASKAARVQQAVIKRCTSVARISWKSALRISGLATNVMSYPAAPSGATDGTLRAAGVVRLRDTAVLKIFLMRQNLFLTGPIRSSMPEECRRGRRSDGLSPTSERSLFRGEAMSFGELLSLYH